MGLHISGKCLPEIAHFMACKILTALSLQQGLTCITILDDNIPSEPSLAFQVFMSRRPNNELLLVKKPVVQICQINQCQFGERLFCTFYLASRDLANLLRLSQKKLCSMPYSASYELCIPRLFSSPRCHLVPSVGQNGGI